MLIERLQIIGIGIIIIINTMGYQVRDERGIQQSVKLMCTFSKPAGADLGFLKGGLLPRTS